MNTYADPWVFEGLFGSDSLGWVYGQHLVDQVLCLWSHCVPLWGGELKKMEKKVSVTAGKNEGEEGRLDNACVLMDWLKACICKVSG